MARRCKDWLNTYLEYTAHNEAPLATHFWAGVSAIAGALQRKVYIDQYYFNWFPNFYIILVGPSGVITKSTTMSSAERLLREVPKIHFGANVITWQAIIQDMSAAIERPEEDGEAMACLTFYAGELGTLLDPEDRKMIDVLTDLWDGKMVPFKKSTATQENYEIPNPWINIAACTTPTWLSDNLPKSAMDLGFMSRVVLVYADKKRNLMAYPKRYITSHIGMEKLAKLRENLVHDLIRISLLCGEYKLTEDAFAYGEQWYGELHGGKRKSALAGVFDGYLHRKQGHVHKLAMVIAASKRETLTIEKEDLEAAVKIVDGLEQDMSKIITSPGNDVGAGKINDILRVMQVHRKLAKKSLYSLVFARTRMAYDDFKDALESAMAAGVLEERIEGNVRLIILEPKTNEDKKT